MTREARKERGESRDCERERERVSERDREIERREMTGVMAQDEREDKVCITLNCSG